MTREEARSLKSSPVFIAFIECKAVQYRFAGDDAALWRTLFVGEEIDWRELINHPYRYRVKPEPREWTLRVINPIDPCGANAIGYPSATDAETCRRTGDTLVRVREVID